MPLETGTKISELNPLWPLGGDPKSQGDDHLRLIKSVVQGDTVSRQDGGTFEAPIEVPDGATGKQVPHADDVQQLIDDSSGTPVEIVEADVVAGWQVWGDTLVQWGNQSISNTNWLTLPIAFKNDAYAVTTNQAIGTTSWLVTPYTPEETRFRVRVANSNTGAAGTNVPISWMAIGEAPDALKKAKEVLGVPETPDP